MDRGELREGEEVSDLFDEICKISRIHAYCVTGDEKYLAPVAPITVDLGCANNWRETPQMVKSCRDAIHTPTDTNPTAPRSGLHYVRCDLCGYKYTYDTSD